MKRKRVLRNALPVAPSPSAPGTPPRRILVVDDNQDIRRLNVEVLAKSGYEVETAEDGAVAWYNLQLKAYDLLITDHDMPHLTGFELLKKVRAARMPIPVIMATESLPKEEYAQFPWLQPTMTLLHPYTTEEFLQTVEGVLLATDAAPPPKARRQSQSKSDGWLL